MKFRRLLFPAIYLFFLLPAYALAESGNNFRILFVTGSHSGSGKISLLKKSINAESSTAISIDTKADKELGEEADALHVFNEYHLVILDSVSERTAKTTYEKYQGKLTGLSTKVFAMKAVANSGLRVGISEANARTFHDYYDNGGAENFKRLVRFIQYRMLNIDTSRKIQQPILYPEVGLYHPDYKNLIFPNREAYISWRGEIEPDKLVIALNLQRASIESDQTMLIDEAIKRVEAAGHYALPFFFDLSPLAPDYSALLQAHVNGQAMTVADVMINFRSIHWANQRKVEFKKFGIPVLQAITYYDGDQKSWEQSKAGISSGMMPFSLSLPESAGIIDPIVVAGMNQQEQHADVIDYQLDFMIQRAINYAVLANKNNADKKITTMFWGDRDMGASFLNVPESLRAISHRLNDEGYSIDKLDANYFVDRVDRILTPFYREYELESLLKDDLAELLPLDEYTRWLKNVPQQTVDEINEHWGRPEDNFMVTDRGGKKYFVIPRIRNGNMLVLRQPPRGDSANTEMDLYHNTKIPMNHYYLATYFYAREYWKSDAFIHLGTHGTHEYLPGKDRGLSRYDGANLSTGTLPVVYPYIMDDVGEAVQAKRRGNAVTVSHMTPPFAAAGLQGVTYDMNTLLEQYRSIDTGGVKEKTKQRIIELCQTEKLCNDLSYTQEQIDGDFDGFIDDLHEYLEELASTNQPLGLHSFGDLPEQRLIISTLGQMLGAEFLSVAAEFEKRRYATENDHDTENEPKLSSSSEENEGVIYSVSENLEYTAGYKTLDEFVVNKRDDRELSKPIKPYIEKAKKYYANIVDISELENLVAGLNGQYIPPKNGGDPVRNPESLPTGFNLIGFDPSRLPTKAAYEQGKELVEEIIANYYKKHTHYPDKLAFSLWSIEAMRHYGVLESQAMYAMGIRPKWSSDGRVTGTEIIPASELKRPRVDVVLSATGLYRDAFPSVMEMLAKAIKQLSELKESSNSIWENSQKVKAQLMAEGVDAAEAEYLSSVRIFSNTFGSYGSGVDEPIMRSDTWDTDKKIADNYLATMGHYFGADKRRWGKVFENLYAKQLAGTDVAIFARSSNLYGMITSDDPFEYFGSLALAVRNIDGKSPEMMITNLRNARKAKMEMAADMLAKELRTRNFHKRWISEMQKEGYSGAVTMSGNLSNFWGWQVVAPDVVRNDQWDEFFEVYIEDKYELGLNQWFEEVNPKSQQAILERMLEAARKEYWEASEETLQKMIDRFQYLSNKYELVVQNQKLREFIMQTAQGYGMDMALPAAELRAVATDVAPQIAGRKLEQVDKSEFRELETYRLYWLLLACFGFIIVGSLKQFMLGHRPLKIA